jgi:hypothetical protein
VVVISCYCGSFLRFVVRWFSPVIVVVIIENALWWLSPVFSNST